MVEVKKPSDLPKAKKHKPMDSDEDDEELHSSSQQRPDGYWEVSRTGRRLPTDRFSCFHTTRISDELPDGSEQRLGSFHIDLKTALLQCSL